MGLCQQITATPSLPPLPSTTVTDRPGTKSHLHPTLSHLHRKREGSVAPHTREERYFRAVDNEQLRMLEFVDEMAEAATSLQRVTKEPYHRALMKVVANGGKILQ